MREIFYRYGLLGSIRLIRDVIFTKLFFSNRARIVRFPFYVRGMNCVDVGAGFTSGVGLRLDVFPINQNAVISIGDGVQVNDYVHIAAIEFVKIGDRVLIASKVFISDHNHGFYAGAGCDSPLIPPEKRKLYSSPVCIGDDVWIGESVSILPGVNVGKGAIIGANSVVTRDIPQYCIAAGVPAMIIKKYDFESDRWLKIDE